LDTIYLRIWNAVTEWVNRPQSSLQSAMELWHQC